jgi:hypothetical protein
VLAVGAVNVVGAIVGIANGWDGSFIGLAVSALILVLGYFTPADEAARTSPAFGDGN